MQSTLDIDRPQARPQTGFVPKKETDQAPANSGLGLVPAQAQELEPTQEYHRFDALGAIGGV